MTEISGDGAAVTKNQEGIPELAISAPPAWRWRGSQRAHQGRCYVLIKHKHDTICDTPNLCSGLKIMLNSVKVCPLVS